MAAFVDAAEAVAPAKLNVDAEVPSAAGWSRVSKTPAKGDSASPVVLPSAPTLPAATPGATVFNTAEAAD